MWSCIEELQCIAPLPSRRPSLKDPSQVGYCLYRWPLRQMYFPSPWAKPWDVSPIYSSKLGYLMQVHPSRSIIICLLAVKGKVSSEIVSCPTTYEAHFPDNLIYLGLDVFVVVKWSSPSPSTLFLLKSPINILFLEKDIAPLPCICEFNDSPTYRKTSCFSIIHRELSSPTEIKLDFCLLYGIFCSCDKISPCF